MKEDFLTVLDAGVWMLVPLAVVLIVGIILFSIRYVKVRKEGMTDPSFMHRIRDYLFEGDVDNALRLAENSENLASSVVGKGITLIGSPISEIVSAMDSYAATRFKSLGAGMGWLRFLAFVAPMLGFIGCAIGWSVEFYQAAEGRIGIAPLFDWLSQSLITLAAGFGVGIVLLFFYSLLSSRLKTTSASISAVAEELLDILRAPSA